MLKMLSDKCVVCDGEIQPVLNFPELPLTGIYSNLFDPSYPTFNQELMVCTVCGHGQLKYIIEPGYLYGSTYGFRTSESNTASAGSNFFATNLQRLFPGKYFERILEFGSNDGYLINLLKSKGNKLLGIDPAVKVESLTENVKLIKGTIEQVDFMAELGAPPDLVISQHTMEHLENPKEAISVLFEKVNEGCMFLLEFPCLDPLLEKYRFDQIFHQHIHYFSVNSALKLLDEIGAELVDYTFNYNYWGALLIAFRKPVSENHKPLASPTLIMSPKEIQRRFAMFQSQMSTTAECCMDVRNKMKICGYGAALMLPVLAYHMKTDLNWLDCIIDDDPAKNNMGYVNLPVRIQNPNGIVFEDTAFLLTAIDNRRPIMRRLIGLNPKMIVNPLNIT
ncbi:MAG: methyltransferase domain-containing protein [Chlorobium sp.]